MAVDRECLEVARSVRYSLTTRFAIGAPCSESSQNLSRSSTSANALRAIVCLPSPAPCPFSPETACPAATC